MRMLLSLIGVSVLALNAFGASPSEDADREAELHSAVNTFGQAFLEADVPTLQLLLTKNYVHVNGGTGNVIGQAEWLNWVTSRRAQIESGELRITEYRIEETKTAIHGDTAIVVGMVFSSYVTGGELKTSRIRFTNTWLYQDGKWLRAAFHDSTIP